jgi:hypothetical protein
MVFLVSIGVAVVGFLVMLTLKELPLKTGHGHGGPPQSGKPGAPQQQAQNGNGHNGNGQHSNGQAPAPATATTDGGETRGK